MKLPKLQNLVRSINIDSYLEKGRVELDIGNIYIRIARDKMTEFYDGCARLGVELPQNYHVIHAQATNIGAIRDGQFFSTIGYDQFSAYSIKFFQRDTTGPTNVSYIVVAIKI